MSQQTITINGIIYDSHTGLPLGKEIHAAPALEPAAVVKKPKTTKPVTKAKIDPHHSHDIHRPAQKSQTLNRKIVKNTKPDISRHPTVNKSPAITKFAPHPVAPVKQAPAVIDIAPISHPIVQKVERRIAARPAAATNIASPHAKPAQTTAAPMPASAIKQVAIGAAMQKSPSHHSHKQHQPKASRTSRMMSVASAGLALLLLGGYFTYLNMPNLSVRVAAAQAGINASYPSYHPDGYSLNGPVAYDQGEVSMKFAANTGEQSFTVTQSKTNWDSTAAKENYVQPQWGDDVTQYAEHGLTIYAHEGNAAWVNGGILYTIKGDAPLSASQIRDIATSM